MGSQLKTTTLFFLLLLVSFACNKKMTTQHKKLPLRSATELPAFDKEGHRGCRGLMPENTIPAMLKALDIGVTTLEMDASFSKDKKILLSHEPFFNHIITTKPDGSFINIKEEHTYNMYQMEYDSIKTYDVGLKPHPSFPQQQKMAVSKPLLSDVFDSVKKYMANSKRVYPFFNIETKCMPATDNIYHPAPPEFVEWLMNLIIEKKMEQQVIIQSFDFRSLQYLHQHYPAIKTAVLIEMFDKRSFEEQIKVLGFTPTIYSPENTLVNKTLIEKCHLQNIKVIPWTVNDTKKIAELKALGVDGIISDYPNLFNQ
ncbi:MAG: glycerophosphodiester phosphodiesterase [Ferruginibacter sp.]|nr:glycerophosphodiester phosphodiesterase [Ferruginibacter sp.]